MLDLVSNRLIEVAGSVAIAVILVLVGVQKILKDWKSTSTESNVISLMHTELERMAEQNTSLSVELGRLHGEVIALNHQLQKLTVEKQHLQLEVVALTREVARLQAVLHKGET